MRSLQEPFGGEPTILLETFSLSRPTIRHHLFRSISSPSYFINVINVSPSGLFPVLPTMYSCFGNLLSCDPLLFHKTIHFGSSKNLYFSINFKRFLFLPLFPIFLRIPRLIKFSFYNIHFYENIFKKFLTLMWNINHSFCVNLKRDFIWRYSK